MQSSTGEPIPDWLWKSYAEYGQYRSSRRTYVICRLVVFLFMAAAPLGSFFLPSYSFLGAQFQALENRTAWMIFLTGALLFLSHFIVWVAASEYRTYCNIQHGFLEDATHLIYALNLCPRSFLDPQTGNAYKPLELFKLAEVNIEKLRLNMHRAEKGGLEELEARKLFNKCLVLFQKFDLIKQEMEPVSCLVSELEGTEDIASALTVTEMP